MKTSLVPVEGHPSPCVAGCTSSELAGRGCRLKPGTHLTVGQCCPAARVAGSNPPFVGTRCRGHGKSRFGHRFCYPGSSEVCNYPDSPWWVDPDPCPAIKLAQVKAQKKRQRESNDLAFLPYHSVPTSCCRSKVLRRKAVKIVKLLQVDQSLKPIAKSVPTDIVCGGLRRAVRSMFAPELALVQELSIKTSAKAEVQPCAFCEDLQEDALLESYVTARYSSVTVDGDHIERFTSAFSRNVPQGWNVRAARYPYVPNGSATLHNSRREGGNWNSGDFSDSCSVVPIFTAGKWRTVTVYSEFNVSTLSPLHDALYAHLTRRNWLLVGSPTDERLRYLQAGCKGTEWLSFDYVGATDNIKTAYVQRAVETLIEKGEGLTDDEVRCLRVVARLRLGDLGDATKGQPMGSPMSFPLLCLINKTIVDMALADLLVSGEISFKEWTSHRCLINGDDLLTRSTSSGSLADAVFRNGTAVGMESNWDKTLTDPEIGEINSTCFKNCVLQKKTNVSALWMSAEVTDVLGYAHESCCSQKGFLEVVVRNASRLARQKIKTWKTLPYKFKELLFANRTVKKALFSGPASEPPSDTNLFPVVVMPEGYYLTREEEVEATLQRVRVIRERRLYVDLAKEKQANAKIRRAISPAVQDERRKISLHKLVKPTKPTRKTYVLGIFASYWKKKRMEELLAAEPSDVSYTYPSDLSRINLCLDLIKTFKDKRNKSQAPSTSILMDWLHGWSCWDDPFRNDCGYVSLTDDD